MELLSFAQNPETHLIFDLDGTLADSLGVWREIDKVFFAKRGLEMFEDYEEAVQTMGLLDAAAYTVEHYNLSEKVEKVAEEFFEMALDQYKYHIQLRPGAVKLLRALKKQNRKLSICSASEREFVLGILDRYELTNIFEDILISGEMGKNKSEKEFWELVLKETKTTVKNAIVFEDSAEACKIAKLCGIKVIGLGVDNDPVQSLKLKKLSDIYFDNIEILSRWIFGY